MIRRAETDADLGAYAALWSAVWPDDPISLDFVLERLSREPDRLYLLAEFGGAVVGTGFVRPSARPCCFVAVSVVPERRREGLGSQLFDRCIEQARAVEAVAVQGTVREDDAESLDFVMRRGFVVTDRVVSLALEVGPGLPPAAPPDGIEIAELDEARLEEAFAVFAAGVADIPAAEPAQVGGFDEWVLQLRAHPLTLVALDAGLVVGFADLELRNAEAGLLENNLTTVLCSHRRRGIAEALKRSQIEWASANGYRRLTTATHDANEPMRRLNEKLGFRALPALLDVSRRLEP